MKKIIIARPQGFCAGVVRAIKIVELALQKFPGKKNDDNLLGLNLVFEKYSFLSRCIFHPELKSFLHLSSK